MTEHPRFGAHWKALSDEGRDAMIAAYWLSKGIEVSDEEIAMIGRWVDAGAPEGNPADMPPPKKFAEAREWALGKPDLIVASPDVTMEATQPDWWGQLGITPTGLTEDRYIASSEIREVNDIPPGKSTRTTVGGLNVFHHASVTIIPPPGVPRSAGAWWCSPACWRWRCWWLFLCRSPPPRTLSSRPCRPMPPSPSRPAS